MTTQPTQAPEQPEVYTCPRHPDVETNLRCGKCGQFICPRCMVQTPVGARCQDCAKPVRNPAFSPSTSEGARAVFTGALVAGALGFLLSIVVSLVHRYVPVLMIVVSIAGLAGIGYLTGEVVYRMSGYKRSRGLSYLAGLCAFVGWAIAAVLYPFGFVGIWALLGLGVGVYVAMGRLRI